MTTVQNNGVNLNRSYLTQHKSGSFTSTHTADNFKRKVGGGYAHIAPMGNSALIYGEKTEKMMQRR